MRHIARLLLPLQKEPHLYFHGHSGSGLCQDLQHPGLWLADRLRAAWWYTQTPLPTERTLSVFSQPQPLPNLSQQATVYRLCLHAGLDVGDIRHHHKQRTLYLTHQEALCQAARELGFVGLEMKDMTIIAHQSQVLWTLKPTLIATVQLRNGEPPTLHQ